VTPQQLKNSILQMAMQGKLVEQRPEEGTGEELYQQIQKEKQKLIKEGKIKKEKPLPEITEEEIPFEIPESWKWVRHNEIIEIIGGSQPPKKDFITEPREGYIRLYQTRDYGQHPVPVYVKNDSVTKFTKNGDILLARYGGSLGKVFFAKDGAYNVALAKASLKFDDQSICKKYLFYYYHTSLYQNIVRSGSRSAQAGFNKEDLNALLLPIPPLAEQKRIVAKIEELMPRIDRYAVAYDNLQSYNTRFPEDLKKSILQQAIQGKLVPQDPNDEPASELLKKIAKEKAKLVKEGKIKKQKPLPPIKDEEIPFDIPESWKWVRLGTIIDLLSGTDFKPDEYSDISGKTVYITGASCLSDTGVIAQRWTNTPKNIARRGDLLLVCKGSGYGKCVICDVDEAHIARQIMAIRGTGSLDLGYVRCFLMAEITFIKRNGQGVIPGIDRATILNMELPLPPLAEQKRIVAKLDEQLLPQIDGLKENRK
jgi:type I restriction enzyme S subunit